MNLFVGFAILACLIAGEFQAGPTSDLSTRLCMVGLIACLVPSLALWQSFLIAQRDFADDVSRERSLRRLNACHTAVWLAASLAIIHALRWHEVVRFNFGLEGFVILDELIILAPILLSLIASWAIFYDLDTGAQSNEELPDPNETSSPQHSLLPDFLTSPRLRFLTLRVQLQILVILLPVLTVFAFRDVRNLIQDQPLSTAVTSIGLFFAAGLFAHSFLVRTIWPTEELPSTLEAPIEAILSESGTQKLSVRRWITGKFVVNACVMGFWKRRMLLSDRLVEEFPKEETLAVVRHELGHLHLNHVRHRIMHSLLPILAILSASLLVFGDPWWIENVSHYSRIRVELGLLGFGIFFAAYLAVLFRHLSHATEYEADLFSCCRFVDHDLDGGKQYIRQFCDRRATDMAKALLRLAAYHPQQFRRATWMHPSLKARIQRLNRLPNDFDVASALESAVRRRRINALLTYGLTTLFFTTIALIAKLIS